MGRKKTAIYWAVNRNIKILLATYDIKISGDSGITKEMKLTHPYLCKVINGKLGTSSDIANQLVSLIGRKTKTKLSLEDCFKKVQNAGQEVRNGIDDDKRCS